MKDHFQLRHDFTFEAAHRLPQLPQDHKCFRLHGHSFKVTIIVDDALDERLGWVMDYAEIRNRVTPVIRDNLDHNYLNEVKGLENPTSENIARWLWQRLKPDLPQLSEVIVHETCQTACHFRRE